MKAPKFDIKLWWVLIRYEWSKLLEKAKMAVVWALPGWVIYWASIRLIAAATSGKRGHVVVPELGAMDALKAWEEDHR